MLNYFNDSKVKKLHRNSKGLKYTNMSANLEPIKIYDIGEIYISGYLNIQHAESLQEEMSSKLIRSTMWTSGLLVGLAGCKKGLPVTHTR